MTSLPGPGDSEMSVRVPETVLDILRRLEHAGYETWCVGGSVRDALLGEAPGDFDLATAALPADIRRIFARTVPLGIEHGTVGVLDEKGGLHEVTSFRKDVRTDGRHAVVEFGVSLDDDLARRDFTINAIAYHPLRAEWRDPFAGRDDLSQRILRAVGDPQARFREDRLRILRAARFSSRFDFEIDLDTMQEMISQGPDTGHLSAERVRSEWIKSLETALKVDRLTTLWEECAITTVWLPEFTGKNPSWNFLGAPGDRCDDPVILTALIVSANAPVWRRFKGSGAEIARAEAIDRGPLQPHDASSRTVRRWMAEVGDSAVMFEKLASCSFFAPSQTSGFQFWTDWSHEMLRIVERGEATSRAQLVVRGQDLIDSEIASAGPAVGRILDRLLDEVLENPELNTREALFRLARQSL